MYVAVRGSGVTYAGISVHFPLSNALPKTPWRWEDFVRCTITAVGQLFFRSFAPQAQQHSTAAFAKVSRKFLAQTPQGCESPLITPFPTPEICMAALLAVATARRP